MSEANIVEDAASDCSDSEHPSSSTSHDGSNPSVQTAASGSISEAAKMVAPNPLDILTAGLGGSGVSVVFKQKLPDGSLEDTKASHMDLLKTRTNVATMAQALQGLTQNERLEWAILTKNMGNELYANQKFAEALEKYVECLTAANFDGERTKTSRNRNNSNSSVNTKANTQANSQTNSRATSQTTTPSQSPTCTTSASANKRFSKQVKMSESTPSTTSASAATVAAAQAKLSAADSTDEGEQTGPIIQDTTIASSPEEQPTGATDTDPIAIASDSGQQNEASEERPSHDAAEDSTTAVKQGERAEHQDTDEEQDPCPTSASAADIEIDTTTNEIIPTEISIADIDVGLAPDADPDPVPEVQQERVASASASQVDESTQGADPEAPPQLPAEEPQNVEVAPKVEGQAKVVEEEEGDDDTDICADDNNVDTLVMPVLCNMAACCMQLQSWARGAMFCDQALKLRPSCTKALMRKGICLFNMGEYKQSLDALQEAIDITDEERENAAEEEAAAAAAGGSGTSTGADSPSKKNSNSNPLTLKPEDVERTKIYIGKANNKYMFQKRAEAMHKKKLQKVFNPTGNKDNKDSKTNSSNSSNNASAGASAGAGAGADGSNAATTPPLRSVSTELEIARPGGNSWYAGVMQRVMNMVVYAIGGGNSRHVNR